MTLGIENFNGEAILLIKLNLYVHPLSECQKHRFTIESLPLIECVDVDSEGTGWGVPQSEYLWDGEEVAVARATCRVLVIAEAAFGHDPDI